MSSAKWGAAGSWGDDDTKEVDMPASAAAGGDDLDSEIPERHETEPDANGIKTITEYRITKGQKVKITRKVKVEVRKTSVKRAVIARRRWKKFGDCAGKPPGIEFNVTYHDQTEVTLNLEPNAKREETDEKSISDKLREENKQSIVVCRHCGETGHWTLKCPKRNSALPPSMMEDPTDINSGPSAAAAPALGGGAPGRYVPPNRRGGSMRGSTMHDRDDASTLRVTNLPDDISEQDLAELFRPFGRTQRIYLAKDRITKRSRGFAFINYDSREDAANARAKLDGYGYANLILRVEWAKPREEK